MSSPHNVALKDIIKPDITDTSQSLELHWSQQMKEKTSRFLVGRFRNITKDGQAGIIFVEHIMLHEYQKLLSTDGTITVTSSFQYGDKTPATRWLVYQNKQNKMFQHRFISTLAQKAQPGSEELEMLKMMGLEVPGGDLRKFMMGEMASVGRGLKDFREEV